VWDNEDDDDVSTDSDDDSGRLYDFVVAKTNDQEENVVARPGFTVHYFRTELLLGIDYNFSHRKMDSSLLIDQQPLPGIHVDHKNLSPRLLYGETAQGIMTAEFKQAETVVEKFVHRDQSAPQIRLLL